MNFFLEVESNYKNLNLPCLLYKITVSHSLVCVHPEMPKILKLFFGESCKHNFFLVSICLEYVFQKGNTLLA